ncbi:putative ribonuclease H-like domain-containing protein [Tanacetum coccineum]
MVPRAVLMKTGLKSFNTTRTVNTAHPKSTVYSAKLMSRFSKSAQSTVKRPYQSKTILTNKKFSQKVNTAKVKVNTVRPKAVNIARPNSAVVNTLRANQANVVKALACWVWRPTKLDSASITLKKHNYIDARGRSKSISRSLIEDMLPLVEESEEEKSLVKILKNFIKEIEKLVDKKVKIIRSDNGTEFKNKVLDDFCIEKGIKREYSVARTPQQNGVAERRNMTLIKAARTIGFKPALSFMRPFGCHVTILNTLDSLGKFDGKSDEVAAGTISNESAGTQEEFNAGTSTQKEEISQGRIVMPIWKDDSYFDLPSKDAGNDEPKSDTDDQKQVEDGPHNESDEKDKSDDYSSHKEVITARQHVNTVSPEVNTGCFKLNTVDPSVNTASSNDQDSPKDMFKMRASHTLEATHVEFFSDEDKPEVDLGNILNSYTVWILVDLPIRKRAIGIKWVFRNKKNERGIEIRNKARLVTQVHRQEEGIDYEEVFAPVARIKAIRLFSAYASFMGFMVCQMDVKSAFLYGTIEEEVYVTQPPRFKDHDNPDKVYKVVKALYGLHQAPRAWYETLAWLLLGMGLCDDIIFGYTNKELCTAFEKIMKDKFQMSSMGELTFFLGLQVTQKEVGIFISQDKYVAEILKKFNYRDVKSASTLVELEKRFSQRWRCWLMLIFQVTPKISHLLAIKRIFRYLKGKPTLGLWYSRDSPFELVAYTDSDYAGATQDRKSTTGGCQFLGNRLISWQCKKQTVVATSTTEAEYVAAASCCGQVLWIQNQLLDYGYNFMNTMIHIDNNSTICIIENPVQHSKTKHIEIRHHFIRDCNAKKLIQMVKIDTEHNVADLLTKGFDAGRQVKRGRDTKIPQSSGPPIKVGDEVVHKELGDRMERAATTASSLEAEQHNVSVVVVAHRGHCPCCIATRLLPPLFSYPATVIVASCSLWSTTTVEPMKFHRSMKVLDMKGETYRGTSRSHNSGPELLLVFDRKIGIRALSYRELGCISNMSNSDELRHTDNTTLVPPMLPDILPQVRTARKSIPPIEPNLAERARISAINLDDYQLDPVTPPPSPLSPFTMAAYQWMIAEMDPTQREEALTVYGIETSQNSVPVLETALTVCTTRLRGQLHTILEDMDHYPNACLEELEAFMTL